MNSVVLDDSTIRGDLFPLTLTRHAADIRVGILTLREKWRHLVDVEVVGSWESRVGSLESGVGSREFGVGNWVTGKSRDADATIIPANIIPGQSLAAAIFTTGREKALTSAKTIQYPWHIFQYNAEQILADFILLTKNRQSQPLATSNQVVAPGNVFLEKGAKVEFAFIDATDGPVYIGINAQVMPGALIRGPFALCEGAIVKMGAKIYGGTTVGPYSIVGGEVKNSMLFGYSNKAHDGYLGDSVIGEWCNMGAGTSNSNLKNNAGEVRVWHAAQKTFVPAGRKCGLIMGDYSRCAINTSFNTATIVGICCNIFGEGLTPKVIPDFSWGYNPSGRYEIDKAIKDIGNWKALKNQQLSVTEINNLKQLFEQL